MSSRKSCPMCAHQWSEAYNFCPHDGAPLISLRPISTPTVAHDPSEAETRLDLPSVQRASSHRRNRPPRLINLYPAQIPSSPSTPITQEWRSPTAHRSARLRTGEYCLADPSALIMLTKPPTPHRRRKTTKP